MKTDQGWDRIFAETGIPDHVAPHNNVGSRDPTRGDAGGTSGHSQRNMAERYAHPHATGDAFASHPSRSTSSCACVVLRTNLYTAYFEHNIVCLHAIRWIHGVQRLTEQRNNRTSTIMRTELTCLYLLSSLKPTKGPSSIMDATR